MKKIYTIIFCILSAVALAQVGINTTSPKALFEVAPSDPSAPSNTDGLIAPRINAFPATNPTADQQGMLVYLTTTVGTKQPGFYYWDNPTTSWVGIGGGATGNNWALAGNTVNATTDFMGSTNDADVIFKRNSLRAGRIGINNTSFGLNALNPASTGIQNTASGVSSLSSNTTGTENTASGYYSLYSNTTGSNNTASGVYSLRNNTTGDNNTASGVSALYSNTTGINNVANGFQSLYYNVNGLHNVATGNFALFNNTTGNYNVATGNFALLNNTTGNFNVANGGQALFNNTTGSSNVAIGLNAGSNLTAGSNNVFIGDSTQPFNVTASNYININNQIYGNNGLIGIGEANPTRAKLVVNGNVSTDNGAYGSLRSTGAVATNAAAATPTSIWATDRIVASEFNATSDSRIKQNVVPVQNALSVLSKINVVNYTKLSKGGATNEIGIIAQELEKVLPQAVSQSEGDVYNALSKEWEVVNDFRTVNYQTINMLTAKAVQELKQEVNEKSAEIKALNEKNKELELRLQKIEAFMKK